MRWNSKSKTIPKEGDKRIVRVFLFFPRKLEGEWRWLEMATIEQMYVETILYDYGMPHPDGRWVDMFYKD